MQSNGSWSASVTLSGNGSHGIVAKDTDIAGNTGTSTPVVFTLSTSAPVANADTLSATEDTAVTYTAAQLVGNDTDVDGDTLSIASVTQRHRRHRGSQRQWHRHLHPDCQLQRRGQFQLHGERRHRDQ